MQSFVSLGRFDLLETVWRQIFPCTGGLFLVDILWLEAERGFTVHRAHGPENDDAPAIPRLQEGDWMREAQNSTLFTARRSGRHPGELGCVV